MPVLFRLLFQSEVRQLRRQCFQQQQQHKTRRITAPQEDGDSANRYRSRAMHYHAPSLMGNDVNSNFTNCATSQEYVSIEGSDDDFEEARSHFEEFSSSRSDHRGAAVNDRNVQLFAELDRLLDGDETSRVKAYRQAHAARQAPGGSQLRLDPNFMWRLAKCCHFAGAAARAIGDKKEAQRLASEASEAAEYALELQEANSAAHKWRAITLGVLGDYQGAQQRITNGYLFKSHIDRALELNPEDYTAHYLRGRWCWGVYSLSWIERRAAQALFSKPPSCSVQDALDCFLQVRGR